MSKLYKLLNSNKILNTWCIIYAMFLVDNITQMIPPVALK